LKNGIYELKDDEVIMGWGRRPEHRLPIAKVRSWQVFPEMGMDIVIIELNDGGQIRWIDTYNDLIGILKQVAADKEREDWVIDVIIFSSSRLQQLPLLGKPFSLPGKSFSL
jgi:hypothetical protein